MQRFLSAALATLACGLVAGSLLTGTAQAQMGFGNQVVGGIAIDAAGMVANLDPKASEELAASRQSMLAECGITAAGSRKVSLAGIVAAIQESLDSETPVSSEVVYLGGLTAVELVLVDPEGHDIVLVGPAEEPVVGPQGTVVGGTTGQPLLVLEDFIVALRSIDAARAAGMSCSIDPTPEGITRLQTLLRQRGRVQGSPDPLLRQMETAMGPQKVTIGGVPAGSRFAHVLVAADYRMKRIGMGFEPSGIEGLPSYLSMVPANAQAATMPRFWLEAKYEPIQRDPDELAWKLSGRSMQCLTESEMADAAGRRTRQGRADPLAKKWCDQMTKHYAELSQTQPIFAELQNCIDLAVVATLIRTRQLDSRAGLDLGLLLDAEALPLELYDVPATVPTLASAMRQPRGWVVTASGGITFQPWEFATTFADTALAEPRLAALDARPDGRWWWD
jgi:hypothetical protein